jgi:hypothetical protein
MFAGRQNAISTETMPHIRRGFGIALSLQSLEVKVRVQWE